MKTMNNFEFIRHLNSLNIKLSVKGDRLQCKAPQGTINQDLQAEIKERKQEIIAILKQNQSRSSLTIKPVSREQPLPLSFAQQRLWFIDRLEGKSPVYNMYRFFSLEGKLDLTALEKAIVALMKRHEILRTNFTNIQENPTLIIHSDVNFHLPLINLENLTKNQQEIEVEKIIQQETSFEFDLEKDSLIRFTLVQTGLEKYLFLIVMHHIISDGWSMNILTEEIVQLYHDFKTHNYSSLSPLPIQYADFSIWQREWFTGEVLEKQVNYWRKQLQGIPSLIDLPIDKPRPPLQTFVGKQETFKLNAAISKQLKVLAQDNGVTLYIILLTAFGILLHRYTHQLDLVIGSPIANRNLQEIEGLIGFFANTLALRINLEENLSFKEAIERVKKVALEAYEHQDLPFEKLVEELNPERNLSHSPIFQVMFAFQNNPRITLELEALKVNSIQVSRNVSRFDLSLFMSEKGEELSGLWEYNTDLFNSDTIVRMSEHFQTLIAGIISNPHQKISLLPLLSETEKQQILLDWNNTQADYPRDICLHQLFEEQVQKTPEAIAVVYEGQQLTYRELNEKANQLAHYLQELGVKPEIFVGIFVERSLELMIGLLAILKSGGVYIPIDPTYPIGRIDYILNDSKIPIVLTQNHLKTKIPSYERQIVALDSDWNTVAKRSKEWVKSNVNPENLAYLIYTSGSTGNPKGTMVLHRGLVNYLTWATMTYKVSQGDGCPVHSSLSFDATITSLYCPLMVGKKVIMLPTNNEIDALCNCLESNKNLSFVKITPAHLEILNRLLSKKDVDGCARVFIVGGEALSSNTVAFWHRKAPKTSIINEYGPTETVVGCCTYEVNAQNSLGNSIPIGRPIANTQLYILDDYLEPVPIGVTGELYIGGDGVAKGYLNRVQLTAKKFIPNPFSNKPEARLYKTGDLCRYLPDGKIEYLGRIDNQVKIRGFRLELGEIEVSLSQHPHIKENLVIARENQQGEKYLLAYVVPHNQKPELKELRKFLREKLPEYMIPNGFVFLDSFPLTANGKIDRKALPEADWQSNREDEFIPPRNETEMKLATIWQEVLGLEQVGIKDNFFALGGHSLLATQVVSRIRNSFNIELPLRSLFEFSTIGELSEHLTHSCLAKSRISLSQKQNRKRGEI